VAGFGQIRPDPGHFGQIRPILTMAGFRPDYAGIWSVASGDGGWMSPDSDAWMMLNSGAARTTDYCRIRAVKYQRCVQ